MSENAGIFLSEKFVLSMFSDGVQKIIAFFLFTVAGIRKIFINLHKTNCILHFRCIYTISKMPIRVFLIFRQHEDM